MSKRKPKPRRAGRPAGGMGDPRLDEALRLHRAGNQAAAETLVRTVLSGAPRNATALRLLGYVLRKQDRNLDAAEAFQAALGVTGETAQGLAELGDALLAAGRRDAGAEAYFRATQRDPNCVVAHVNLGNLLLDQGHSDAAERLLTQALATDPDCVSALLSLGLIHEAQGRLAEAEGIYERVLQLDPDCWQARANLGNVYKRARKYQKAIDIFRAIIDDRPDCLEALTNLGACYTDLGLPKEAIEAYDTALRHHPDTRDARLYNNRANARAQTGDFDGAYADYRRAMDLQPGYLGAISNFLMDCHYAGSIDRDEMWRAFRRFNAAVEQKVAGEALPPVPARDPEKRLNIGFVSPDFRAHAVATFLLALFEDRDRERVAFHCYSNVEKPDHRTAWFRERADGWRDCQGREARTVAHWIREDGIDILVDLAGHTGENLLPVFAYRPAPLQVTWLGYPDTTGMDAIDYRLTDGCADPPGEGDRTQSETLVRLPGGFHCFVPDDDCPAPGPPPAATNGYVTFGSFNKFAKHSPACLEAWARILAAAPEARLLVKCREFSSPDVAEGLRARFRALGIDPERLELLAMLPKKRDHYALYGRVDLALDTFPYNGTTTTCEALWMGAPVVTVAGEMHAGRVGVSLLHHVGLDELIAPSVDAYVDLAVSLARAPDRLAALRTGLRDRVARSPIADRAGFVRKWQETLRDLWREQCATDATERTAEAPALVRRAGTPPVRILHNLARSGGTLVSKCVGAMAGVALLSEIHPQGLSWFNPVDQAALWYDLLRAEDREALRRHGRVSFADAIGLLEARAHERDLALVLRDWAHLDFMALPFVDQATHRSGLAEALAGAFRPIRFALVRHPLDQWLSLDRLSMIHGKLPLEAYLLGCRTFAEMATETGFLRYEDFARDPDAGMRRLAEALELPFDPGFLDRWADNTCVTGDTAGGSRAGEAREIRSLPRKPVPPALAERLAGNADYRATLDLLGYTP